MSNVMGSLESETQGTWQHRNVCGELSLGPRRAFSLSEVTPEEEGALEGDKQGA